ncbi:MAG: hypothetical protein F4X83_10665 [Chloroflexi bacterium]|nr:hypothetical protein [Chloroflexota bacterium]
MNGDSGVTVNGDSIVIEDDDAAPTVSIADAAAVTEGKKAAFTITLSAASGRDVTVRWTTGDDGAEGANQATGGVDYTAVTTAQTATITAGQASVTVEVQTTDDAVDEDDETFAVTLASPGNATLGTKTTAVGTITDDDTRGVTVTGGPLTVRETDDGGTEDTAENVGTYTVVLDSRPTAAVTVTLTLTPASGVVSVDKKTLTFAPADWSTAQTVTVTAVDDAIDNPGNKREAAIAHAVAGGDYDSVKADSVPVTVTDDDAAPAGITLTASPDTVKEGDGATSITVTASTGGTAYADAKTLTVKIGKAGDAAVSDTDYTAVTDQTITITAGATSGSVTFDLTPTNDTLDEDDESISVEGSVNGDSGVTVNGDSIVIEDDDAAPTVITVTATPGSVAEDGGKKTITITASTGATAYATAKTLTIEVGVSGDTAVEGTDYAAVADQTLVIAAGATSSSVQFDLTPTDDSLDEGDESISVTGSVNGEATITVTGDSIIITDDDAAPTGTAVTIHTYDTYIREDDFAYVRIRIEPPLPEAVTIPLLVTPITAEPGDVEALPDAPDKYGKSFTSPAWGRAYVNPPRVTVAPGQKWWSIHVYAHRDDDSDNETFKVALDIANLPDGVQPGEQTEVLVSVADAALEGVAKRWWTALTAEARRGWLDSILPVNDRVLLQPGLITYDSLGDYARARAIFAAGEILRSLDGNHSSEQDWWNSIDCEKRLMALGLHEIEGMAAKWCKDWPDAPGDPAMLTEDQSEQVVEVCKALLGAPLGSDGVFSVSNATAVLGTDKGDALTFTVSLDNPPDAKASVVYHTRDVSAEAGVDYTAVSGTLTFDAGETEKTVQVPVIIQKLAGPGVELEFVLSLPQGGVIRDGLGTGYIKQDSTNSQRSRSIRPTVSVESGGNVVEGFYTYFRFMATKLPDGGLAVKYTVSQEGDFGVVEESAQVTLTKDGDNVVLVRTIDDDVIEPDGHVTLRIDPGGAYTIDRSAGTAKALITDDDDPPLTDEAKLEKGILARISFYKRSNNAPQVTLWMRALAAVRGEAPPSGWPPMTASEAQSYVDGHFKGGRWGDAAIWPAIVAAIEAQNTQTPVVSISGGSGVTEGGNAVFTLTADPAPSVDISVRVNIVQSGDYADSTAQRTVTIGTGGTATLSIATTNDSFDEPNGSVTAAIAAALGSGYTVSRIHGSATVSVADDDDAPVELPAVSISGGEAVTEGGDAVFSLTASPKPAGSIYVKVSITQSGDYVDSTDQRIVSIDTSGTATLAIATTNDATDEANGSVTATLSTGNGYTVSTTQGSATVRVADDDPPPTPEVSISGGGTVTEGGDAIFTLKADPAPASGISVKVNVTQSGDYAVSTDRRTVTIGVSGTATIHIATANDGDNEADGSITAAIASGSGYAGSGSATVIVKDDDDPPPPTVKTIPPDSLLGRVMAKRAEIPMFTPGWFILTQVEGYLDGSNAELWLSDDDFAWALDTPEETGDAELKALLEEIRGYVYDDTLDDHILYGPSG